MGKHSVGYFGGEIQSSALSKVAYAAFAHTIDAPVYTHIVTHIFTHCTQREILDKKKQPGNSRRKFGREIRKGKSIRMVYFVTMDQS